VEYWLFCVAWAMGLAIGVLTMSHDPLIESHKAMPISVGGSVCASGQ